MTWEEAKDQIARNEGHADWSLCFFRENITSLELLNKQAAELYARSKWDEACIAQRQICWAQLDYQVNQNKVAKSPLAVFDAWDKPKFKP